MKRLTLVGFPDGLVRQDIAPTRDKPADCVSYRLDIQIDRD
jgi:hypothetical protein